MRASRQKKRTEKPKVEERRARSEQRRPSPGAARTGVSNPRAKEASREREQRGDVLNALADRDLGRQVRHARENTQPNAHAETGSQLRHYTLPTAPAVTRTEYRDKFRLQAAATHKFTWLCNKPALAACDYDDLMINSAAYSYFVTL